MTAKPHFEDAESSYFNDRGMPAREGIYEFRRYDGRKILYTLEFKEPVEGEAPRLKVTHASRMADYPYPAHALNTLDGAWVRWLGLPSKDTAASPDAAASESPASDGAGSDAAPSAAEPGSPPG
jgi:hypothetical protein